MKWLLCTQNCNAKMKLCADELETDLMKQFHPSFLPTPPSPLSKTFVCVNKEEKKRKAKNSSFCFKVKAMNKQAETGMQLIYPPSPYTAFLFSSSRHVHKDQIQSYFYRTAHFPPFSKIAGYGMKRNSLWDWTNHRHNERFFNYLHILGCKDTARSPNWIKN